jgi:hypothetical protein
MPVDKKYLDIPAFLRRPDSKEYKEFYAKVAENIRKENELFKEMDERSKPTRDQMQRPYDI